MRITWAQFLNDFKKFTKVILESTGVKEEKDPIRIRSKIENHTVHTRRINSNPDRGVMIQTVRETAKF